MAVMVVALQVPAVPLVDLEVARVEVAEEPADLRLGAVLLREGAGQQLVPAGRRLDRA